jgi:hypothetical protein
MAAERQDLKMRIPTSEMPPRWLQRVLRLLLKRRDRDSILGDFFEEYCEGPERGYFARIFR